VALPGHAEKDAGYLIVGENGGGSAGSWRNILSMDILVPQASRRRGVRLEGIAKITKTRCRKAYQASNPRPQPFLRCFFG